MIATRSRRPRLAAGEMHLQNAECRGLGEHPRPGLCVKLASSRVERERIGAIRTAQRTAVRKLGKKAEGLIESGTIFRHVEFSFVMAGPSSLPRNGAGCPCPRHDGLVVTIPRGSCRRARAAARLRRRGCARAAPNKLMQCAGAAFYDLGSDPWTCNAAACICARRSGVRRSVK